MLLFIFKKEIKRGEKNPFTRLSLFILMHRAYRFDLFSTSKENKSLNLLEYEELDI